MKQRAGYENTGQITSRIDSIRAALFNFSIRDDPVLYGMGGNPTCQATIMSTYNEYNGNIPFYKKNYFKCQWKYRRKYRWLLTKNAYWLGLCRVDNASKKQVGLGPLTGDKRKAKTDTPILINRMSLEGSWDVMWCKFYRPVISEKMFVSPRVRNVSNLVYN